MKTFRVLSLLLCLSSFAIQADEGPQGDPAESSRLDALGARFVAAGKTLQDASRTAYSAVKGLFVTPAKTPEEIEKIKKSAAEVLAAVVKVPREGVDVRLQEIASAVLLDAVTEGLTDAMAKRRGDVADNSREAFLEELQHQASRAFIVANNDRQHHQEMGLFLDLLNAVRANGESSLQRGNCISRIVEEYPKSTAVLGAGIVAGVAVAAYMVGIGVGEVPLNEALLKLQEANQALKAAATDGAAATAATSGAATAATAASEVLKTAAATSAAATAATAASEVLKTAAATSAAATAATAANAAATAATDGCSA